MGQQSELIFDFGLHKGKDAEFYLKKGVKVVGVEAVPNLALEAKARLDKYV